MFFLFPVRINRMIKHFPFITVALIAVNTLVLVCILVYLSSATQGLSQSEASKTVNQVFQSLGFTLSLAGFYTWFTSLFVHAGIFHLLGNMIFLWLFGAALEDILGKPRFLLLYFTGGLVAALTFAIVTAIFIPEMASVPLVGASGAIGALLGLFIVRFRKNQISVFYFVWFFIHPPLVGTFSITSLVGLGIWLGWEIFSGVAQISTKTGGVAHWAHIGGFVFGMIMAKVIRLDVAADQEEMLKKAKGLARVGDTKAAASSYERAVQKVGKDPEVLVESARMLSTTDDREKGRSRLEEGISLLMKQGRLDRALQVYEELGGLYSDATLEAGDLFRLATKAREVGRFEVALDIFQKVIGNYFNTPQAEMALLRVGQTYLAMGDKKKAREAFSKFLERYPESEWKNMVEESLKKCGPAKEEGYLV